MRVEPCIGCYWLSINTFRLQVWKDHHTSPLQQFPGTRCRTGAQHWWIMVSSVLSTQIDLWNFKIQIVQMPCTVRFFPGGSVLTWLTGQSASLKSRGYHCVIYPVSTLRAAMQWPKPGVEKLSKPFVAKPPAIAGTQHSLGLACMTSIRCKQSK